jgi:hypothetical protein
MRGFLATLAALMGFGAASLAPAQSRESPQQIWDEIKRSLQGPNGAVVFEDNLKDALIPPPPDTWTGTVVSSEPVDAPSKLVLGFGDSRTPEITLLISENDGSPARLRPVLAGTKVVFSGVVRAFTASPYMLTFELVIGEDSFFLLDELAAPGGK